VAGQWRLRDGGGYDLVIVDNSDQPDIPTGGTMEEIKPDSKHVAAGGSCPSQARHLQFRRPERSMCMLAFKNVSKSFGALKVTDDVSFEVPEGQALGIIGPNGAGKSTLFNLITGNLSA
jgi:ABC-type multidrug transport system fused ATPase/permease subunit